MKVVLDGGAVIELGSTETAPTIGIIDYSRRVTDDFGVTTVVERGFSRRMSVRLSLPTDQVDVVQQQLAALRATAATWVADDRYESLSLRGFYKEFALDLAVPPTSFCTLTVEGLTDTDAYADPGGDPSADGKLSTLQLLRPTIMTDAGLVASNVPENDYAAWSSTTSYPLGARVIKAETHRIYESASAANVGNDPVGGSGKWIDIGPTNRWAMFDQALGTSTSANDSISITASLGTANAVALLDVVGNSVRVTASDYDRTIAVGAGAITFLDLPTTTGEIAVTVTGSGVVSVGTLLIGSLLALGATQSAPSAAITDYSTKNTDDFGAVTIVERAWAKKMSIASLIRSDAVDMVESRVASVRAQPSLWIGDTALDSLAVYGFFKDFSIAIGEGVSKLSLSIEGLSKAAPIAAAATIYVPRGVYASDVSYAAGDIVQDHGSSWLYIATGASVGNAPPVKPATENDFWSAFALSGDDGINGMNGEPGAPGADGVTTYSWSAFADSLDGSLRFTNGLPDGRAFIGRADNRTSATESTNPADYTWNPYTGPPNFGLVASSGISLAGGKAYRTAAYSGAWDQQVYSSESFFGAAALSFRIESASSFFVGLNTDPTTDASYDSIDYAIYVRSDLQVEVRNNGTPVWGPSPVGVGDTLGVQYDGAGVHYTYNGGEFFSQTASAGQRLWLDSSVLATPSADTPAFTVVSFGAAGARGTDGAPGTNGLPGANGTDGATLYTWIAYADSLDGTLNFTTGEPSGRYFIGRADNKTTATESTNPTDYTWSQYTGPPNFGLVASSGIRLAGGKVFRIVPNAGAWDQQVYSTESYFGAAALSVRVESLSSNFVGLNTDPTTDASYASIDFAIFLHNDGNMEFRKSGTPIASGPTYVVGDYVGLQYDGASIRCTKNGTEWYSEAASPNLRLWFDSSNADTPGANTAAFTVVAFQAAGIKGANGINGTDGINGTNGQSIHIAFADSADGSSNFTTGDAGGRHFVGVYTDTNSGSDSGDYHAYAWSPWRGSDGSDGIPGASGYVHLAYANSADGSVDFSVSDSNRLYLGARTDTVLADSTDYHDYAWSLIKGADGAHGTDAISATLSVSNVTISADSVGNPKTGQFPVSIAVQVLSGTTDVTSAATVSLSGTSGVAASYSSPNISLTAGPSGSVLTATITYGGATIVKAVNINYALDGTTANSNSIGITGLGTSSSPNTSAVITYLVGAGKTVTAGATLEVTPGSSGGSVHLQLQSSDSGTGSWSSLGSPSTDSWAAGDPEAEARASGSYTNSTPQDKIVDFRAQNYVSGSGVFLRPPTSKLTVRG